MAILHCTADNHHPDSKMAFELELLELSEDKAWQNYRVIFHIGHNNKVFESIDKEELTRTGVMGKVGHFAFSVDQRDGISMLKKQIESFLTKTELSHMLFETTDPCLELKLERTQIEGEYKFYAWIDAGNSKQLEYTWDAEGIRFLVTKAEIEKFISSLG